MSEGIAKEIRTTIPEFVTEMEIRMVCKEVQANPHMLGDMPPGSRHWRCVLKRAQRRMTAYFSMGPAHQKPPCVEDVLSCIASDSGGIENARDFADWAGECGWGSAKPKDWEQIIGTYHLCIRHGRRLK